MNYLEKVTENERHRSSIMCGAVNLIYRRGYLFLQHLINFRLDRLFEEPWCIAESLF